MYFYHNEFQRVSQPAPACDDVVIKIINKFVHETRIPIPVLQAFLYVTPAKFYKHEGGNDAVYVSRV